MRMTFDAIERVVAGAATETAPSKLDFILHHCRGQLGGIHHLPGDLEG